MFYARTDCVRFIFRFIGRQGAVKIGYGWKSIRANGLGDSGRLGETRTEGRAISNGTYKIIIHVCIYIYLYAIIRCGRPFLLGKNCIYCLYIICILWGFFFSIFTFGSTFSGTNNSR